MNFLLTAEFTSTRDGKIECSTYESLIIVEVLNEQVKNTTIYDKELKMHFEKSSESTRTYEVELYEIELNLTDRLQKAEDLTRRLMFRYDWIQPETNSMNKTVAIANIEELKETWKEIRDTIESDYESDTILSYLDEIEYKMSHQNFVICPMSQYFFFCLIFLGIPQKHRQDWKNNRIVEFSEYEEEQFEESVMYTKNVEDLRLYEISGQTLNDSKTMIHEYNGLARVRDGEYFPTQVDLTVSYNQHQSISNKWVFRLEQY